MNIQASALLCILLSTGMAAKPVSWSAIKQAIAETICFPVVNGKALDHVMFADRGLCGSAAAPNSLASLVDSAIADSWPALVSIQGYELDFDVRCRAIPAGSREARDAAARKILLDDPSFTGPIVSRVVDVLAARGESCPECPARAEVPSRSVSVEDVMPYTLAFISVDPVHTVDSDGKRLEQPKLSFHICTGLNTVSTLPHDEPLVRAGYVAARTDYLRKRLAEQLRAGPDVRVAICGVASSLGRDLALVVTGCPTN